MDQAVANNYVFSDLYTYVSLVSGLPRSEVKLAIIAKFYGCDDDSRTGTWNKIVAAFRARAEAEDGDDQ